MVQFCTYSRIRTKVNISKDKELRDMKSRRTGSRRAIAKRSAARARRAGEAKAKKLRTPAEANFQAMKITDLYRPLKKPITVRIDADVLAWFKKDGRRYQTRINRALRKVMEREMKAAG
jgi:uncharacterized protein (DUF4415 family)